MATEYVNINGSYWQKGTGGELLVVNDPNTLKQLQTGQLSATQQSTFGSYTTTPTSFTNPELIPSGASVPTSADQVNTSSAFSLPTTSPATGNTSLASASTAGLSSLFDTLVKQQQDYQSQLQSAQANQASLQKSFLGRFSSQKSPAQVRADALASLGVNEPQYYAEQRALIDEIGSLNQEYNSVKAAKEQQIAQSRDRLGSMNFINNQIAQIERNAAPRLNEISANINAKAAVLQAKQGLFAEAQNYAAQAVQDVTWQQQYDFQLFQTFYQMNQDQISRLDSKYQNAFNQALNIAQAQWQSAVSQSTEVMNLLIQYPNSGILPTDSLQSASMKVANYLQMNPQASGDTQVISYGNGSALIDKQTGAIIQTYPGSGDGSSTFTTTQLNQGASNAGLTTTEFNQLPTDVKNFYINLSSTQSKDLSSLFSDVNSGEASYQEAVQAIDQIIAPQVVKEYLKSLLPQQSQTTSSGTWGDPFSGNSNFLSNFVNNAWEGFKSLVQ